MPTHIYGIKKKKGFEEPRGRTGIKMQTQRRMLYNDKKTQLTRKTYPKYAPNNRATKDKTQKLIKVKEETDKLQQLTELPNRKSARIQKNSITPSTRKI